MNKHPGFGLAPLKLEGKVVLLDTEPIEHLPETFWMELCLQKDWSREQIHAEVDAWLDQNQPPVEVTGTS